MTEPNEPGVEEPEFSEERVEEMRELSTRAVLVDEDGSAP
jgi:hypothetical protein